MTATDREKLRTTFDSAASFYHQARPDYPDELYDELISLTGITQDDEILEFGAGTGKATLPLARRGYRITCVELGAGLAAEATRNLAEFPRVRVVQADAEEWARGRAAGTFGMMFVATAWHWFDPDQRYPMAARLLRPGGHLAFWAASHVIPEGGDPFFGELQDVYDEIGEGMPDGWESPTPETLADGRAEIKDSGLFADVAVRRFDWEIRYTADDYIRLLDTFSGHIAMEPWQRDRLYGKIRRRLAERPDGLLRRHWGVVLNVGRRAA
ncbi:MAG: class I SAM-dependent methyltransferase [Trebonia sp.]